MHQVPLFLDPTIKFEKVASTTKLEEDPDRWPIEILKVAYKNIPSLRSYEADVELDRVDTARGYAVGKVLIYPNGLTKEASASQSRLLSLPVIVRDHELAPFDVFSYKGSMHPMDESDVQEIMTRPQTFSRMADRDQFVGTNLFGQLVPPNTDHQYNAGSLMKHGSARDEAPASALFKMALASASPQDVEAFKSLMHSEHALRHAYLSTDALRPYVEEAFSHKEKTASEKRAERIAHTKPSVVQFFYEDGNFFMKTANHRCWEPQTQKVSRFDVQSYVSPENFKTILEDGYVTYTDSPITGSVIEKVASDADRVGIYSVWNGPNNVSGVVIPSAVSFDGRPLGIQIFAGADRHAMQEKIAGVHQRDLTVQGVEPRGLGVFVYQEGDKAVAYEPVVVMNKIAKSTHTGKKLKQYMCKKASTGQEIILTPVDDAPSVVHVGDSEYIIPASMKFLPLNGTQVRISDGEAAQAFEHQKTASSSITLKAQNDVFWITGADTTFRGQEFDARDAEFALGGLGLRGDHAKALIKVASEKGKVTIGRTREVLTEHQRGMEAVKVASVTIKAFRQVMPQVDTYKSAAVLSSPRAQELWKQASVGLSKESLDAILSLNFMTPENASIYVNYLPLLEKTSSVLAELVVASRLGMDDVREAAAINAMTQVNAVVKGLEKLSQRIQ